MADTQQFRIDKKHLDAHEVSHNNDLHIVALVRLLARHAAEADFQAAQFDQNIDEHQDELT